MKTIDLGQGKVITVPEDYELCGVCNCDHEYDGMNEEAINAHLEAGD